MPTRNLLALLSTVCLATSALACSDSTPEIGDLQSPSFTTLPDGASNRGNVPPIETNTNPSDAAEATEDGDMNGTDSDDSSCVPACENKTCGDDGCGDTCGACDAESACDESGQCTCEPICDGKLCGEDGCGATCGTCIAGTTCDESGGCVCVPDCSDQECGTDGCEGSCGSCADFKICSPTGTCVPDPEAGCAGLGLAESWSGTFEGDYLASIYGLQATEGDTTGDLSFELVCLPSKILLTGQIVGVASGKNPFVLTLAGTYDPETGAMNGLIPEGTLSLEDLTIELTLAGDLPGSLQPDATLSGTYSVSATSATSILGPIDMNDVDATSDGNWSASPVP